MDQIRRAVAYGALAVAGILLILALPLYVEWLWFSDLGYGSVFAEMLWAKVLLGLVTGLAFFLVVWGSAWYALKSSAHRIELYVADTGLPLFIDRLIRRGVEFAVIVAAVVLSIIVGLEAATHWQSWIAFRNYVPFEQTDPVFGLDIGFYAFKLDFVHFLYRTLQFALVAAAVAAGAILYLTRTLDLLAGKLKISSVAAGQMGLLLALIALAQAAGFRLAAYRLVYSDSPALFGAGYTDVHVRLLSANLASVAAVAGAVMLLVAARRKSFNLALAGLLIAPALHVLIGGGIGALVQRLVVNPDELSKESAYIKRHIEATQRAFSLQSVSRQEVSIRDTLTAQDLKRNEVTLQSVRLWDYAPLQAAYSQLQEIQQYYLFGQVDIDRYTVGGVLRQVMLSPREMDKQSLPDNAQTWVNLRLKYTHGYGLVMSPVNEVTDEGLPRLFIKNIPPVTTGGLEISEPALYFGEQTNDYVIVGTKVQEFHFPRGSQGAYTEYKADSGIRMGNALRRALLAMRFGDLNMSLPGNLTPNSRILFRRNISERVRALAPFLVMDSDPYVVLAEGRMVWIQDAYTTTSKFPYSKPLYIGGSSTSAARAGQAVNYIRNSVKITVDGYTGDVNFYIFDETDPIIRTYQKAFPGMFKPRSSFPEALRSHIRYPEDLFRAQSMMFQTYHMRDVQLFYNRADVWAIPELEQSEDVELQSPMSPYYVVMKLPGGLREEFILMVPFRRANKDNMVAWMCARSDTPNYGELILYEFPKGEQFYGPAQIQARANQDTEISEQLTLWNQQKSRVSRGNLLVIPIERALLYIEPLYLQATNAKIPELKRVIVALGNEVTMQPTLSDALDVLLGRPGSASSTEPAQPAAEAERAPGVTLSDESRRLLREAAEVFDRASEAQRRGDWAAYGRLQKQLGQMLKRASGESTARD